MTLNMKTPNFMHQKQETDEFRSIGSYTILVKSCQPILGRDIVIFIRSTRSSV